MKIINLNESQFRKIFESVTNSNFGTSSTPEGQTKDEVFNTSKITKPDGDIEDSNPNFDIGDEICPQQWGTRYGGIRTAPSF